MLVFYHIRPDPDSYRDYRDYRDYPPYPQKSASYCLIIFLVH